MTDNHDPRLDGIREAGGERYAAFLAAGFREWYSEAGRHGTKYLLQKRIRRGDDTAYFIDCWVHDWRSYRGRHESLPLITFQLEAHFYASGAVPYFTVTRNWFDGSPGEAEAFFADVYDRMGCQPYEQGQ